MNVTEKAFNNTLAAAEDGRAGGGEVWLEILDLPQKKLDIGGCGRFGSGRVGSSLLAALFCGTAAIVSSPAAEAQGAGEARSAAGLPQGTMQSPDSAPLCRQIDRTVGIQSWIVHAPSSCDSLLDDVGGIRSSLASAGFSFALYSLNTFSSNVLNNNPPTAVKTQAFGGQIPTLTSSTNLYLAYTLRALGDPNGQLVVGGTVYRDTWVALGPSGNSLSDAYYYQSLFDKKLEFKIGYLSTVSEYVGALLGGSLAGGANGVSASIQYSQGLTSPAQSTPAASVTYNITRDFYDRFGLIRSTDPAGTTQNFVLDRYSTRFEIPHQEDGAIAINEFGYRHRPDDNSNFMWIRAGYFHNDSGFTTFSDKTKTSHSSVEYILGDYQLIKIGGDHGEGGPARGFHIGGTFVNTGCDVALFCKYAEVRLYGVGLHPSRPSDIVSLVINHSNFSGDDEAAFHLVAPHVGQNTATLTYLAHITPGWYVNGGLGYTEHPAFGSSITTTTSSSFGSALNVLLGTALFF